MKFYAAYNNALYWFDSKEERTEFLKEHKTALAMTYKEAYKKHGCVINGEKGFFRGFIFGLYKNHSREI